MESVEKSNEAKQFNSPSEGNSGLYLYRDSVVGSALKKDLWVNSECIGETAPNTFFYEEVEGDKEHTISTESEFSPNDIMLKVEAGKNYFIRQFIKIGVFVGGAGLEVVDEQKGKEAVSTLKLAQKGTCSK
jgi:hypothetical protein